MVRINLRGHPSDPMTEEWRPAPGLADEYADIEVSNMGRVRSIHYYKLREDRRRGGRPHRYLSVDTKREGKAMFLSVHRAVCEAFHGSPTRKQIVRHLDGNEHNNCADNLAWGSHAENYEDTRRHGRVPIGSKNHGAKLDEVKVLAMRLAWSKGASSGALSCEYGISSSVADRIISGKTWKHVGGPTHPEPRRRPTTLTPEAVREIRKIGRSIPATEVGKRFGVTGTCVHYVLIGRTWRWVK